MISIFTVYKRFLFYSLLGLIVACSLMGCPPPPDSESPKADTINQINVFLETSASMSGYLKGNTEFKNILSEIINKANQIEPVNKPLAIYTISSEPKLFNGGVTAFIEDLAKIPLATGKSSELHKIFGHVGETARQNNIAVFISDCILSFPDADIKLNPNINVDNAESTLKNEINQEFARLKKDTINSIVYSYLSAFNGPYYDYQNKQSVLQGEKRPFYVWIIGKQRVLNRFNHELQALLTNKPDKQLEFGAFTPVKEFSIFYDFNNKGGWDSQDGKSIGKFKNVQADQPAEFSIGVDLSSLPAYAQTESYLSNNLAISTSNTASVQLLSVKKKEAISTALSAEDEKTLSANSHILTFRVTKLLDSESQLTIKLPLKFDTWYLEKSTMDDREPSGRSGKTFAVKHLMDGVREAYESNSETENAFLKLTINLYQ